MGVHFDSHGRRRVAAAIVAVAVAVALVLAYTIVSTRKATDEVIANVSEVYLGGQRRLRVSRRADLLRRARLRGRRRARLRR